MSKSFTEHAAAWKDQVRKVADSRYFAHQKKAEMFVAQHVVIGWQAVLGSANDDVLIERFHLTPTQIRILHLFGRGVQRVGAIGTKAPKFLRWPPSTARDANGDPVFYEVVPTADIARIVGASRSAVEQALHRFKQRGGGDDLHDHRLCSVVSLSSGVCLDGVFDAQLRLPYTMTASAYFEGRVFAQVQRVNSTEFSSRQLEWTLDGLKHNGISSPVIPVPAPGLVERRESAQ